MSEQSKNEILEVRASRPYGKRSLWYWECPKCGEVNELADGDFRWRGPREECKALCDECDQEVVVIPRRD